MSETGREEIINRIRSALGHGRDDGVTPVPSTARITARVPGDLREETGLLLEEATKLGVMGRRLPGLEELDTALAELVKAEHIEVATVWETPELDGMHLKHKLQNLGVECVSSRDDKRALARCDLGITGVDAALPETGTLLLRSSNERPRLVSLLPRVHLAIMRTSALYPDLHQALAEANGAGYFVLVTGPSRTADIEMALTIGVHGPKALYLWILD